MTTNYLSANDEMFALFLAAWNAGAGAVVDYVPEIFWPDDKKDSDISKYYCKVSQQTVTEDQATIKSANRRFQTNGLIFVQIFCPTSDKAAAQKGAKLAVIARNAFRGKKTSGGVVFHKARILEIKIGTEQFKVVAEYEYDELT